MFSESGSGSGSGQESKELQNLKRDFDVWYQDSLSKKLELQKNNWTVNVSLRAIADCFRESYKSLDNDEDRSLFMAYVVKNAVPFSFQPNEKGEAIDWAGVLLEGLTVLSKEKFDNNGKTQLVFNNMKESFYTWLGKNRINKNLIEERNPSGHYYKALKIIAKKYGYEYYTMCLRERDIFLFLTLGSRSRSGYDTDKKNFLIELLVGAGVPVVRSRNDSLKTKNDASKSFCVNEANQYNENVIQRINDNQEGRELKDLKKYFDECFQEYCKSNQEWLIINGPTTVLASIARELGPSYLNLKKAKEQNDFLNFIENTLQKKGLWSNGMGQFFKERVQSNLNDIQQKNMPKNDYGDRYQDYKNNYNNNGNNYAEVYCDDDDHFGYDDLKVEEESDQNDIFNWLAHNNGPYYGGAAQSNNVNNGNYNDNGARNSSIVGDDQVKIEPYYTAYAVLERVIEDYVAQKQEAGSNLGVVIFNFLIEKSKFSAHLRDSNNKNGFFDLLANKSFYAERLVGLGAGKEAITTLIDSLGEAGFFGNDATNLTRLVLRNIEKVFDKM